MLRSQGRGVTDSRVQPLRSSSSRKPASQEQRKEPARLAQWCSQPPRPDAHSSTSAGKPGLLGPVLRGGGHGRPLVPSLPRGPVAMLLGDAPAAAVLPTRVRVTADTLPAGGQAGSSQGCSPHSVREASDHRPGSGQAGPDSRADSRHSEAGHRQGEPPPGPPWAAPALPGRPAHPHTRSRRR